MPYTVAVALMYGGVDQHHFDDEFLANEKLLALTGRVKVAVSEEANRRVPEAMLCDVEVVTKSGQSYSSEVAYHKGHYKNPLSDQEVEDKFRSLAQDRLPESKIDALLDRLWHLEDVDDVKDVIRLTASG